MEEKQLIKNALDLEYQGESQRLNTYLALLTTGILGFIGTFIWLKSAFIIFGLFIASLISFLGILLYRKSSRRMNGILTEIKQMK